MQQQQAPLSQTKFMRDINELRRKEKEPKQPLLLEYRKTPRETKKIRDFRESFNNFRKAGRELVYDRNDITKQNFVESYTDLAEKIKDRKFVVDYIIDGQNRSFPLNSRDVGDIFNEIYNDDFVLYPENDTKSGESMRYYVALLDNDLFEIDNILRIYDITKSVRKDNGAYFKYVHDTDIDLTSLQIISDKDDKEKFEKVNKNHCFIHSIEQHFKYNKKYNEKLQKLIDQIKLSVGTANLRLDRRTKVGKKLDNIIKENGIKMVVTYYDDNMESKPKVLIYGVESEYKVNLILFREHFMANKKVIVNKNNNLYPKLDRTIQKKSITILRKIMKEGRFTSCKYNVNRSLNVTVDDIKSIDIENDQALVQKSGKQDINLEELGLSQFIFDKQYYFADFESIVYNTSKHLPYMLGVVGHNIGYKSFTSETDWDMDNCTIFTKMLKYIISQYTEDKKVVHNIYFHNLKYDFALIKANNNITITSELNKNGVIYSVDFMFISNKKTHKFRLIDSYKMISHPLSKFQNMFNLNLGKMEFDFYNIIDRENYKEIFIKTDEFRELCIDRENLSDNQIDEILELPVFKKNTTPLGINFKNIYDKYLELDCLTLKEGMDAFAKHIKDTFEVNSFESLTVSSLAYKYMKIKDCLEGTYTISNNLQEYVMKAVTGGRVCLKDNKKQEILAEKEKNIPDKAIADFDGVSLYPSAIMRTVIPKGKATVIPPNLYTKNIETLNKLYSQYIITLKVKLNKYQQIPMISKKVNNVREWTNEIDEYITIDKTTLEDLIKFQNAEILDIKYGVGWKIENGTNENLKEIMQGIFDERLIAKQDKNIGRSESIKLIMNSIYGKSMLRDCSKSIKYIRGEENYKKYILNNYSIFESATEVSNPDTKPEYKRYRIVIKKSFVGNSNSAHIGCFILSMSKRIMNEVLDVANENDLPIYYTDTDSIHIQYKHVEKLSDNFKKIYNRNLVGKQLGQFHIDFNSNYLDESTIYSKHFIGVGKKCYLDILTDKDNEKIDYHIRFKGASKENILEFCKKEDITVVQFYQLLKAGKPVTIDLCTGKVRFNFTQKSVSTKNTLLKKFKF